MNSSTTSLEALNDIKKLMDRSSRFISLSGWSGISAGICALAGVFAAHRAMTKYESAAESMPTAAAFIRSMLVIAFAVLISAFLSAFFFTYLRSRKEGIAIWGTSARRLLWNTFFPMVAGGAVIFRLLDISEFSLISPCCLIFYGLAIVNGSKYTLGEIRYMGYLEIMLGIVNLWYPQYWLALWATGFGVLHILYGTMMWWKYER